MADSGAGVFLLMANGKIEYIEASILFIIIIVLDQLRWLYSKFSVAMICIHIQQNVTLRRDAVCHPDLLKIWHLLSLGVHTCTSSMR